MKGIISPVFGPTVLLEEGDEDIDKLRELINKYPVDSFGIINRRLNDRGACVAIGLLTREEITPIGAAFGGAGQIFPDLSKDD